MRYVKCFLVPIIIGIAVSIFCAKVLGFRDLAVIGPGAIVCGILTNRCMRRLRSCNCNQRKNEGETNQSAHT